MPGRTIEYGLGTSEAVTDPLKEACAVQWDAAAAGFDWDAIAGVAEKVREEVGEIESALNQGDIEAARRELGDLLFASVNLARFLATDAGAELHRTNERFRRRFGRLREEIKRAGLDMRACTLDELDIVWERVKRA